MRLVITLFAAVLCGAPNAFAQSYPAKPIRLVVPFPPGGLNDVISRLVSQKVGEIMGQAMVIENRGGATGTIGSGVVAKSAGDGYTLLSSGLNTAVLGPLLYKNLSYDQFKDLQAIGRVGSVASIVLLHPSVPANSMRELVDLARAKPGSINFGSGGAGGSQHVGGELLKALTGVQMTHIPYSGGGPAMIGLLSGQTQIMIEPLPSALPQMKSAKVKALAVTLLARLGTLPELPTVAESGVPNYDMPTWLAWFAPASTPREIMTKLNAELARSLRSPDLREQMLQRGTDPIVDSLEEANAYVRSEMARWTTVVRDSGMKVE
ncbi:MAG: Bug family tripartite tricarboxylate transporter substrate binding protein [Burkholderiales bacterium]